MKSRLLSRIRSLPFVRKGEGDVRSGPWHLPITGGWLPADVGSYWNWWQMGGAVIGGTASRSAVVEACLSAYSQTVAMCPGDHWRANDKGGRDRVTTSALARILRHPNDYQSISDFMLNMTRSLYQDGNAYALAYRNDRFEIKELHMMDPNMSYPRLARNGDVFYQLAGNDVVDKRVGGQPIIAPMRDVLHIRLHTTNTRRFPVPLIGEPPLTAAADDIAFSSAVNYQQTKYYLNEARPSAVLSTDLVLDKEQVSALRDRWNEQARGLGSGGTPILTAGLKVQPWAVSGKETAVADMAKMSKENIALAYRIPLQILGLGANNYSSTELLMQSWIASGLGFALNHIEEAFGLLFDLRGQPEEYVEFSTTALLRSAFKDRIDALTKGVQGGIMSPNEARAQEDMDEVKFGDEPRVQQQVVPLSAAGKIGAPAPGGPPTPSPHPPPAPPQPPAPPAPQPKAHRDDVQREIRNLLASSERIGRRRVTPPA